ncbi:MAG: glycosyl transferase family 2, partial [Planctomycetes bacterium]|nr:glycosyl transferase family 2 [Planctomycetota bacterium]
MENVLLWIVVAAFAVATLALATYGFHLYVLLMLFRRRVGGRRRQQFDIIEAYLKDQPTDCWPVVTTQIPIYNESQVARRVIEAAAAICYPQGKHELQILDDSDDHTRDLIDGVAERLRADGGDIKVV